MKKTTLSIAAISLLWCAAAAHRPVSVMPVPALAAGSGLSIVTLNLAKETGSARIVSELRANPVLRDADILLLQEVKDAAATEMAAALDLRVEQGQASNSAEQGLAILSRFPLRDVSVLRLPAYNLGFHSRLRFGIAATAMTPAGPLRVFDTHLDTRLNATDRLAQIAPILDAAANASLPVLIGGDFNSNGFYWLGHILPVPAFRSQSEGIWNFMGARGFHCTLPPSATTFDYLGMHLDWIWGRGVRIGTSAVYPLRFSDHHAVWTQVALPSL